jgi:hypothetical protein
MEKTKLRDVLERHKILKKEKFKMRDEQINIFAKEIQHLLESSVQFPIYFTYDSYYYNLTDTGRYEALQLAVDDPTELRFVNNGKGPCLTLN